LSRQSRDFASRHANVAHFSESAALSFGLTPFRFACRLQAMNFAIAPSKSAARVHARIGAGARALVVAMTMLQDVVLPPRSPGPGRP
jgi:hypothetical protein